MCVIEAPNHSLQDFECADLGRQDVGIEKDVVIIDESAIDLVSNELELIFLLLVPL